MKRTLSVSVFFLISFFTLGSVPCLGNSNVLFILDSSGSMWGMVDDVPKIDTAKDILTGLIGDLPKDTNVGLMAYGHRDKEDCQDVEVLTAIGPNNPGGLSARIDALKPKGKTPLTYSLEQSLPLFESFKGQNNSVVLVSDGVETCGGEPSDAAAKLAGAGFNLKVHVVGFDVSDQEQQKLRTIAVQGNGRYFNAENAEGLKTALAKVKKEVQKTQQPPSTFFLKNNIHYYGRPDRHGQMVYKASYANYVDVKTGHEILPVNSEVEISVSRKRFKRQGLQIGDAKSSRQIFLEYNESNMRTSMLDYIDLITSTKKTSLENLSSKDQKGIKKGKAYLGMSKDGIRIALGYPAKHRTPSLESHDWVYWIDRWRTMLVRFNDQGIVTEIH